MQGRADPVSDKTFARAIEAVSGRGQVRWGVEHLYYEVSRRTKLTRRRAFGLSLVAIPVLLGMSMVVGARSGVVFFVLFIAALCFVVLCGAMFFKRRGWNMPKAQFESLWNRWCTVHGTPKGLIVRRQEIGQTAPRAADPDLALYSFDRAVICDRARTVDLLLANNFLREQLRGAVGERLSERRVRDRARHAAAEPAAQDLRLARLHGGRLCARAHARH